jgi:hypothetical protein
MLIGVVGKANVGKTTFFKALSLKDAEIANYPFTTINPNEAVGYVTVPCACKKLGVSCNPRNSKCVDGTREIPVKLLDVAGLVPDAHLGKGRGVDFLDDLRQADALIQVLDASGGTNENGKPVDPGSYDPSNDVDFIPREIDAWFHGILKKNWGKFSKQAEHKGKELHKQIAVQFSGLRIDEDMARRCVEEAKLDPEKPAEWTDEQLKNFATLLRHKSKKIIIAANKADLPTSGENIKKMQEKFPDLMIIPCSAESELALREADEHKLIKYIPGEKSFEVTGEPNEKQKQALEFIKKSMLDKYGSTGVEEVLRAAVFDLLKMIVVYPVANMNKLSDTKGNVLPDAFLVPQGATLKQFAEKVHTDMAERFIGGLDLEKRKIGADYALKDGDVVEILFSK